MTPVRGEKIPDSFIARPGTRYKINLNFHGGGWKDKYDLRDKIRRFRLRLQATGIDSLVMREVKFSNVRLVVEFQYMISS